MSNEKFDWEMILKDSAKIVASSLNADKNHALKISNLYKKLEAQYQSEGKSVPKFNTYRQFMHRKLNMGKSQENVQNALYQLAGTYAKMSLPVLAKNVTVASDNISNDNCWLFIRLKNVLDSNYVQETDMNKWKIMYYLSQGLKKKYSDKILFISFDTDTIAIMCADNNARERLVSYFQKHGLGAESISKEC